MKITLCGSSFFHRETAHTAVSLASRGHEVAPLPPILGADRERISANDFRSICEVASQFDRWIWNARAEMMRHQFNAIAWADAILVLNLSKNGIPGYIGPNTLLDMGRAFQLGKPIFLVCCRHELQHREEVLAMSPIAIEGNFDLIRV